MKHRSRPRARWAFNILTNLRLPLTYGYLQLSRLPLPTVLPGAQVSLALALDYTLALVRLTALNNLGASSERAGSLWDHYYVVTVTKLESSRKFNRPLRDILHSVILKLPYGTLRLATETTKKLILHKFYTLERHCRSRRMNGIPLTCAVITLVQCIYPIHVRLADLEIVHIRVLVDALWAPGLR